ncbi:MAG TPA: amidohydrolase, partial [Rhodanobacter sp.]|nr:amidohydrolase [Rhodanobacter sp.]
MNHRQSCLCCAPPSGAGTVRIESSKNPLQTQPDAGKSELRLKDFRPRSMLRVPKTHIERPRFPVIDVHAHLSWSSNVRNGISVGEEITLFAQPEDLLPVMDRKGIRTLVNLTGGVGAGLEKSIRSFDQVAPGRFLTLTEPSYEYFTESNYAQLQGDAIAHAKRVGARGLKLLKTLGLYLRERID